MHTDQSPINTQSLHLVTNLAHTYKKEEKWLVNIQNTNPLKTPFSVTPLKLSLPLTVSSPLSPILTVHMHLSTLKKTQQTQKQKQSRV